MQRIVRILRLSVAVVLCLIGEVATPVVAEPKDEALVTRMRELKQARVTITLPKKSRVGVAVPFSCVVECIGDRPLVLNDWVLPRCDGVLTEVSQNTRCLPTPEGGILFGGPEAFRIFGGSDAVLRKGERKVYKAVDLTECFDLKAGKYRFDLSVRLHDGESIDEGLPLNVEIKGFEFEVN